VRTITLLTKDLKEVISVDFRVLKYQENFKIQFETSIKNNILNNLNLDNLGNLKLKLTEKDNDKDGNINHNQDWKINAHLSSKSKESSQSETPTEGY